MVSPSGAVRTIPGADTKIVNGQLDIVNSHILEVRI